MSKSGDPVRHHGVKIQHRAMAVFFLNGLTLSTFLVRMPSLKAGHHLTDAQLGAIGMLFAAGALAAMQVVGRLPARPVLRLTLLAMPVLLGLLGVVPGQAGFAALVTVLGAVHGATDAAMNTHAITVERLSPTPILNRCHAAWSTSAIIASLATIVPLPAAAVPVLIGGLLLGPRLLAAAPDPAERFGKGRWTAALLRLGLTGTVLMICEGAALGWGAIFLHDSKGASFALAATAITAYTLGQTVGRLCGDRLISRIGQPRVFRAGSVIAACGLTTVVLTPYVPLAAAGFAVMGLGTSTLIPSIFTAVGRLGTAPTTVLVSRLTTFTYAGILLGPALMGWSAALIGLHWTFLALAPVLIGLAATTRLPAPSNLS
jgi:hypothetical protein